VRVVEPARRHGVLENGEFVVVAGLVQDWDGVAGWLIEDLFADDAHRRAFLALAEHGGRLDQAIEHADPEAREVLERAAVADLADADFELEARNLIAAAVRRELARRVRVLDADRLADDRQARLELETGQGGPPSPAAAEWLLGWLERRNEHRGEEPSVGAN
jgi:hypothetical protein